MAQENAYCILSYTESTQEESTSERCPIGSLGDGQIEENSVYTLDYDGLLFIANSQFPIAIPNDGI